MAKTHIDTRKELFCMRYTVSFHNGTKFSQKHNRRDLTVVKKQKHINLEKEHLTFIDYDYEKAFKELFEPSLNQYNEKIKTKHPERVKTIDEYFNKLDTNLKENERAMKPCYECIFAIGNKDAHPDVRLCRDAMIDFIEEWGQRNPNLKICGAYMHFDEEGTPHTHIDYIPVAHCSRGMSLQPNREKALNEQGFYSTKMTDTALIQWERSERNRLREICIDYGLELEEQKTQKKERQERLDVLAYKTQQETERLNKTSMQLEQVNEQINECREYMLELAEISQTEEYQLWEKYYVEQEELRKKVKNKGLGSLSLDELERYDGR